MSKLVRPSTVSQNLFIGLAATIWMREWRTPELVASRNHGRGGTNQAARAKPEGLIRVPEAMILDATGAPGDVTHIHNHFLKIPKLSYNHSHTWLKDLFSNHEWLTHTWLKLNHECQKNWIQIRAWMLSWSEILVLLLRAPVGSCHIWFLDQTQNFASKLSKLLLQAEKPWMIGPWSCIANPCMIKVQSFMVFLPGVLAESSWEVCPSDKILPRVSGNRTQDLGHCNPTLWPLTHRGRWEDSGKNFNCLNFLIKEISLKL